MRAFETIMDCCPMPYQELTVPTAFGETHVIAIVPDAHHITAVAQPEIVNRLILRFFSDESSIIQTEKEKPCKSM